jgi:hypothetical protein
MQDARIRDGSLLLPPGHSGTLRIPLPSTVTLPGPLVELRLSYGRVRLTCEIPDAPRSEQTTSGVDFEVNTMVAATDG